MAPHEFNADDDGLMSLDMSKDIDPEKAAAFALGLIQEVEADYTSRPLMSAYRDWCEGTGPAIEDPQTLLEAENLTTFGFGYGPGSLVLRDAFVTRFGHAFATAALIERLAALGPLLELGAGLGMIAHLVKRAGGDIIATDIDPSAMTEGGGTAWTEIKALSAADAMCAFPGRTLLCSWPGGTPWLTEAVRAMEPGQKLIVIAEGPGGATATDCFYETIGKELIYSPEILGEANVWCFPMIKDHAYGFTRRET